VPPDVIDLASDGSNDDDPAFAPNPSQREKPAHTKTGNQGKSLQSWVWVLARSCLGGGCSVVWRTACFSVSGVVNHRQSDLQQCKQFG